MIDLIVIIICSTVSITFGCIIFTGNNAEKKEHMHYEKCDFKSCEFCIDKEQCPYSSKEW